jgi:hypothetical protein
MFSQIHEIVFHGNGGFNWDTVYSMPIWLRNFTYEKIKEYYDKQNEELEQQQKKIAGVQEATAENSGKMVQVPSYVTKVAKK